MIQNKDIFSQEVNVDDYLVIKLNNSFRIAKILGLTKERLQVKQVKYRERMTNDIKFVPIYNKTRWIEYKNFLKLNPDDIPQQIKDMLN